MIIMAMAHQNGKYPVNYAGDGIKDDDLFVSQVKQKSKDYCKAFFKYIDGYVKGENVHSIIENPITKYPLLTSLGWETKNLPIQVGKRILLPVYSDGLNFSMMLYTDDYGKSWKYKRHIQYIPGSDAAYPTIIAGKDDMLHVVFSASKYSPTSEAIKYFAFDEQWIKGGDQKKQ